MAKEENTNQFQSIQADVINTTEGLTNYLGKLHTNQVYRIHFSLGQAQSAILIDTQVSPMQVWSRNLDPRPERIAKNTLTEFLQSKGIDPNQLKDSFQSMNRWEQFENFKDNLVSTLSPISIDAAFKNIDDARLKLVTDKTAAKVSRTGMFSSLTREVDPVSSPKKKFDL